MSTNSVRYLYFIYFRRHPSIVRIRLCTEKLWNFNTNKLRCGIDYIDFIFICEDFLVLYDYIIDVILWIIDVIICFRMSTLRKWAQNTQNKLNIKNNNTNGTNGEKKWIHPPGTLQKGHIAYLVKFLGNIVVDQPKGNNFIDS